MGSLGSALAAIPKRRKNLPHKSRTADFLKLFIFVRGACGTYKTRLKILDSNFTNNGVYLHQKNAHLKSEEVSEVRYNKIRLLHLGNVEKSRHPQLSPQRACEG